MQYKIKIEADLESSLSRKELENKLVIALHDTDTGFSKFDGIDHNLKVIEYIFTKAKLNK